MLKSDRWVEKSKVDRTALALEQRQQEETKMEESGVTGPGPSSAAGAGVAALHPAVVPLSWLLGTWRGQGQGGYPTITSFAYGEELCFSSLSGKPIIAYSQKTWNLNSGEPMHAESGYWKPKPDGSIELVIAQSTGLVEVQKGTYNSRDQLIKLESQLVGNASKVREIRRVFELVNGELNYVVEMATSLTSLQPHLKAVLKKL